MEGDLSIPLLYFHHPTHIFEDSSPLTFVSRTASRDQPVSMFSMISSLISSLIMALVLEPCLSLVLYTWIVLEILGILVPYVPDWYFTCFLAKVSVTCSLQFVHKINHSPQYVNNLIYFNVSYKK